MTCAWLARSQIFGAQNGISTVIGKCNGSIFIVCVPGIAQRLPRGSAYVMAVVRDLCHTAKAELLYHCCGSQEGDPTGAPS